MSGMPSHGMPLGTFMHVMLGFAVIGMIATALALIVAILFMLGVAVS